jgi:hypothetical protein
MLRTVDLWKSEISMQIYCRSKDVKRDVSQSPQRGQHIDTYGTRTSCSGYTYLFKVVHVDKNTFL